MPTQQSDRTASRQQATEIKNILRDARDQARNRIDRVQDPKAQALLETTAEVLQGLMTAYEDFDKGSESAWQ